MVTINKQDGNFIFEVKGMHKLWAFKNELTIPASHIINAHQDAESLKDWKGWRAPGISIPFLVTAGTFVKDGDKIFWDVTNADNCIIVDLRDEEYKQLIIEVDNPAETIKTLTS